MTAHAHSHYVEGCYRCDLSRDEATAKAPQKQCGVRYAHTEHHYERPISGLVAWCQGRGGAS
jgi:hypothetical protein